MILGDVINNIKKIECSENEFETELKEAFKGYRYNDVMVGKIGRDFFTDKRFDIDYQVTFNPEGEPAIKVKVEEDDKKSNIKVIDAWV